MKVRDPLPDSTSNCRVLYAQLLVAIMKTDRLWSFL